jgi:phage terminase large subunit-like protein
MTIDPDLYKKWTPAAQEKALEALRAAQNDSWRPFYCPNAACNGQPHDTWQWNHGRSDQRPPTGTDWLVWLMKSGRGSGKTRTGTEITHRIVEKVPRISLIGPTAPDIRDIMLEGESGILRVYPPGKKPVYEPSKRRVTFHNGATATLFSGEEPDRLRGPESYWAWVDEGAHIAQIQAVWDNLMFGLRLGRRPWVLVTTTPLPRPWLKTLIKAPSTRISAASTYDNLANLSAVYREVIIPKYEGTRLGRQELNAEVLEDVEGALWSWELIERARVSEAPDLDRIVVGVDPAGSKKKSADETGIVVAGIAGQDIYILADRSGHYSPAGWAAAVNAAYEEFSADAVVVEKNFGGEMVEHTLRSSGYTGARVLNRTARRGKALRAEPVVGRYEKDTGHIHHVGRELAELETQMTEWQPYEDADSPDRVDALVYACTELMRGGGAASVTSPTSLRRDASGRLRVIQGGAA